MTRTNLAYAHATSDRHVITVATWIEGPALGYRFMVDGLELEVGAIL